MKIHEIREMPTTVTRDTGNGVHESVLRAYQILQKVQYWLREGVPTKIVLELIEEMDAPTNRTLRYCNGVTILDP